MTALRALANPAFRAGISVGLLLSVAVLLGGNALAAAVTWARDHYAVVISDGHPIVVEEVAP